MFAVARMLNDPEHGARTTVELAREISPALLRRVAERGLDPEATTRDVIECARLVLDRAYGRPVESVALAHADMNAPSAAERHQRAQAALARLARNVRKGLRCQHHLRSTRMSLMHEHAHPTSR